MKKSSLFSSLYLYEPELELPLADLNQTDFSDDLVVFSHLRWEFVKQRPQHVLERLSKGRRLLFIEEPIPYSAENKGTANELQINSRITVVQPRIDGNHSGQLTKVTEYYLQKLKIEKPILWFYSAAFVKMIKTIDHSLVVYDCMDELSAFKGASAQLRANERQLIRKADVMFTGGKSLYDSKKSLHANIHCFPSSVDRQHFESVFKPLPMPADLQHLPRPIVGFYGVLDERIDMDLLKKVADAHPAVSFVMIGPLAKISPDDLPQARNLHYLGQKDYQELPAYLKYFDAAVMPFALNEATRFISPTKTLEFMAALKPIVSTAIYDVVRDYQKEVYVAQDHEAFSSLISQALNETADIKQQREARQTAVIDNTSWFETTRKMKRIISQALQQKAKPIQVKGEGSILLPTPQKLALQY